MNKIITLFLSAVLVLCLFSGCSNTSHSESDTESELTDLQSLTENPTASDNTSQSASNTEKEIIDYQSLIVFPASIGTYDYYSYGYHYSTTTLNDYSYKISEQSSTQIRVDFEFHCRLDYMGENAAGISITFFANIYSKNGNKISENIINESDVNVGENITFKETILIDKADVNDGIIISFEGNQ